MKSEKETIYDYATELKLLAFKEELEYTLSLAAGENWSHLHFLTIAWKGKCQKKGM